VSTAAQDHGSRHATEIQNLKAYQFASGHVRRGSELALAGCSVDFLDPVRQCLFNGFRLPEQFVKGSPNVYFRILFAVTN